MTETAHLFVWRNPAFPGLMIDVAVGGNFVVFAGDPLRKGKVVRLTAFDDAAVAIAFCERAAALADWPQAGEWTAPPAGVDEQLHQIALEVTTARGPEVRMSHIDDMGVFDHMRGLLDTGIDLDDRAAVEAALANAYDDDPQLHARFVDWCIKAAKANKAAGGLQTGPFGSGSGFVPPEDAGTAAEGKR